MPKFHPEATAPEAVAPWLGMLDVVVEFPIEIFYIIMTELIHHPERTSSIIMRADVNVESLNDELHTDRNETFPLFINLPLKEAYRRILRPRNPKIDPDLHQQCRVYGTETYGLVIFIPSYAMDNNEPLVPFYHPRVERIAFTYSESRLRIYVVPLDDISNRLNRTILMLGKTIYKHGHGRMEGYEKRVHHDVVVQKETFQDTYVRLKSTYAQSIISGWVENTDPSKHVFEDLGIAAFLICLWGNNKPTFVDVGCGNGLLVWILTQEGYNGYGVDMRRRKSWDRWANEGTPASLRIETLHPKKISFPSGSFLIGNHADELTPWMPIFAALSNADFINIPCCLWQLGRGKFTLSKFETKVALPTSKDANTGRYGAYIAYIADLTQKCGYTVQYEALRIPSTRNWCLVCTRSNKDCTSQISDYLSEWTDTFNTRTEH